MHSSRNNSNILTVSSSIHPQTSRCVIESRRALKAVNDCYVIYRTDLILKFFFIKIKVISPNCVENWHFLNDKHNTSQSSETSALHYFLVLKLEKRTERNKLPSIKFVWSDDIQACATYNDIICDSLLFLYKIDCSIASLQANALTESFINLFTYVMDKIESWICCTTGEYCEEGSLYTLNSNQFCCSSCFENLGFGCMIHDSHTVKMVVIRKK